MTGLAKLLSATLFFGLLLEVQGQTTFTAKSCNESDVAAAINSAISAGSQNIASIPAGTCTWTTPLNLTLPNSTSLSIIGAGNSSIGGGDQTVIVDNVNHASSDNTVSISTGGPTTSFRWSGITIDSSGNSTISNNGVFTISGTSQSVRIDHSHFKLGNQALVNLYGQIYGVMDHDLFDQADLGVVFRTGGGWNATTPGSGDTFGDGSWNDTSSLGSNRFMFVENSTFNSTSTGVPTPSNDCVTGGRFVIRYNTFNGGGALQTHPTGHAYDDRGCRSWEIYGNTFAINTVSSTPEFNVFFMSSGTGVIWGNTVAVSGGYSSYEYFVTMHSMLADDGTYTQSAPPASWGYCGTQVNGTGSAWDQNTNTTTGYACLDQPGRGMGDLLSGTFPTKCDSTTGCSTYNGTWPNEALEPVYEWMDSWSGAQGYPAKFWNVYDTGLTQNVDYYFWCNSASLSGCTSFNGTVGVGSGTLATRPSTCTTGVAYWATDQGSWNQSGNGTGNGVLYKCTSTNTWTASYTPYTYPHPLDTSTPTPAPPTLNQPTVTPQ